MELGNEQINRIISLARSYGATRLILFGSAAKVPAEARDIDLACDGAAGWKLYEMAARIEDELHALVDIIPLSPPNRFTKKIEERGRILL